MKHKTTAVRFGKLAVVSLIFQSIVGCVSVADKVTAEKKAKADSVVKLSVTYQAPSFYAPWIWRAPSRSSGQGIVIGKNLVLTLAANVMNAKMIEMTLDSEPVPARLRVVAMELNANLALLNGDLPKNAKPLRIPYETSLSPGDPVRMFWKTSDGMTMNADAVLDRVETRFNYNSSQGLAMWHAVKASHPGNGWGTPVFDAAGTFIGLSLAGSSDYDFYILTSDTIRKVFDLEAGKLNTPTAVPGFLTAPLTQPYLRKSLGVADISGGCMVTTVFEQGSGHGKLKTGDVILSVCGNKIDAWGRYDDPVFNTPLSFERIFSQHYITDEFPVEIVRDGKRLTLNLDLSTIDYDKWLVPANPFNNKLPYLVRGGFVFIPLSKSYLKEWGDDYQNRAPLYLVDAWRRDRFKVKSKKREDVVIISRVLPHPSNLGLQNVRNMIISEVDGKPLGSLASLKSILDDTSRKVVKLTLQPGNVPLLLSPRILKLADPAIKRRYGINKLESE